MNKEQMKSLTDTIMADYYDHFSDKMVVGSPSGGIDMFTTVYEPDWNEMGNFAIMFETTYKWDMNDKERGQSEHFVITPGGLKHRDYRQSTFTKFFRISENVEEMIIEAFIRMTLDDRGVCPIKYIKNLPPIAIEVMLEKDVFNTDNYIVEDLMKMYEIIGDERILPQEIKDVFVF